MLPGGTAANGTNATWSVPVYHAHSTDPCHASTFAASKCGPTQAWRWNLDYVVDPHKNAAAYYYQPEANYYGANGVNTPVAYTRGGYLTNIDYGLVETTDASHPNGTIYGAPPSDRISFTPDERCFLGAAQCTDTQFVAGSSAWSDTPSDLNCASSGACTTHTPTFWTRKRLKAITTEYRVGPTSDDSAFLPVDSYALAQSFPATGDAELELDGIVHTGYADDGTTTLKLDPGTEFDYDLMANRIDGYQNQPDLPHWRMITITDETGRTIDVKYNQTGRAKPACTTTTVPTDASNNTTSCFPVRWTPAWNVNPINDFFQKYVVTEVDVADHSTATNIAPTRITTYTYAGDPAWHYDDNEVVKPADRTWGQWRGYGTVETRIGNPNAASNGTADLWTLSTDTYFRGMYQDRTAAGTNTKPASLTSTITGDIAINDDQAFGGMLYQHRDLNYDGGAEIGTTVTTPQIRTVSATRSRGDGLPDLTANVVRTLKKRSFTDLAAGGTRVTTTDYAYDDTGRQTYETDSGTNVGTLCHATTYATNTLIQQLVAEQTSAPGACPTSGSLSNVLSDTRTYYDGSSTLGAAPSLGDPSAKWIANNQPGQPRTWSKSKSTYDASGRIKTATVLVSATDTTGRKTTTAYAATTGGQLAMTTVTDPLGHITKTSVDAGRGNTTKVIDQAGQTTEAVYDALGRRTSVWKPGQSRTGSDDATVIYTYQVARGTPLAVSTSTLVDPGNGGATTRSVSVSLYNDFGEARQTQTQAANGTVALTDTYYDSHGWIAKSNNNYAVTATLDPDHPKLFAPGSLSAVDSRTVNFYDGAGRITRADQYLGTTFAYRSRNVYGGDRTTVIPPTGGVEQTTVTDVRGQAVEIDRWTTAPTLNGNRLVGGVANAATYHYTVDGKQDQMVTAAGTPQAATWTRQYDLAGRVYSMSDPDTGTTTTTYDNTGAVTSTTDARGATLAYQYDAGGRKTGLYNGSLSGTLIASWTYDTLQVGKLTSSSRFYGTDAYTVGATGYDAAGNATGSATTVPASDAAFGGTAQANGTHTFTTAYTWSSTHLMASQTPADGGSLPHEQITSNYNAVGQPTATLGFTHYVTGTTYSSYGEPVRYDLGVNNQSAWLTYSYDTQTRRLKNISLNTQSAGTPQVENTTYSYDFAGNLTKSVDVQGPTAPVTETQCFQYDTLDQLSQAWSATDDCAADPSVAGGPGRTVVGGPQAYWESWTVDAGGGRTSQTKYALTGTGPDTTTNYTNSYTDPTANFTNAHALSGTIDTGASTATSAYTYNADGTTKTRQYGSATTQQFNYTPDGKLDAVAVNTTDTVTYRYDADGNQLVRRDPGSSTLYLPGEELHVDSSGVTGTRYYTHNGQTVMVRVGFTIGSWMVADPNGTEQIAVPLSQTTGTSTPVRRYLDPYGNSLTGGSGAWPDNHGFLDKSASPSNGLVDVGARKYDPATGRFLTVDPVSSVDQPQQDNGYSYGWNSPLTHADPDGTRPEGDLGDVDNGDLGTVHKSASAHLTEQIRDQVTDRSERGANDDVGYFGENGHGNIFQNAPARAFLYAFAYGATKIGLTLTGRLFYHWLAKSGDDVTLDPTVLLAGSATYRQLAESQAQASLALNGSLSGWKGKAVPFRENPDLNLALRGLEINVAVTKRTMSDGSDQLIVTTHIYKRWNFDPTDNFPWAPDGDRINEVQRWGQARNYDVIGTSTKVINNYQPGQSI